MPRGEGQVVEGANLVDEPTAQRRMRRDVAEEIAVGVVLG
jgi:hypothetical protein